jgi:hypothetical protein
VRENDRVVIISLNHDDKMPKLQSRASINYPNGHIGF